MAQASDIAFMKRAIDLSTNGFGLVNPNPLVGAVLVKNGEIIGEGYHESFGGSHAEINAINNAGSGSEGSTLYVTLEPCDHQGKTPPCTERIIKEGIAKVMIGMNDPNPLVNGKGIDRLLKAGIKVKSGLLETEIRKLNEIYFKYIQTSIPFCAMKTAMTLDGKIATYTGESKWISNEKSRLWVHGLRQKYAALMVGVNTVIVDNPKLTNRSGISEPKNPVRIIVDTFGRTPLISHVLETKTANTIVATTLHAKDFFLKELMTRNVDTIICPENDGKVDLGFLMAELGKKGIDSVLLEGGSTLNFSALKAGIVDKIYSFISPQILGGQRAYTPVGGEGFKQIKDAIPLTVENIQRFDEDIMIEAYINKD